MAELWELTEKERTPLNNPSVEKERRLLTCNHCEYTTKFTEALNRHISRYHERELAARGNRGMGKEGDKYQRDRVILHGHGYIDCPWFCGNLCPGPLNPMIKRVCGHLAECPGGIA